MNPKIRSQLLRRETLLKFDVDPTGETLFVDVQTLIIAGWAGREQSEIDAHIKELEEIGVSPPSTTPLFYRVAADLLTSKRKLQFVGPDTSGEVEVVLIGTEQGTIVTVGSDHTDRHAETLSVALSKQACVKPVSERCWWLSDVIKHWDQLRITSSITTDQGSVVYQSGNLDSLLPPRDLLEKFGAQQPELPSGFAMYCGTLPVIDGVRPADVFSFKLEDPILKRSLEHSYQIDVLPVVS